VLSAPQGDLAEEQVILGLHPSEFDDVLIERSIEQSMGGVITCWLLAAGC